MTRLRGLAAAVAVFCFLPSPAARAQGGAAAADESYLGWSFARAEGAGKQARVSGRVGGWLDARVIHTERSFNFKLRATWFTPDVIRASARLAQLRNGASAEAARAMVAEAEAAGDTVIMVEIDPREGSGVIPLEWEAYLQPAGKDQKGPGPDAVPGVKPPGLRDVKAFAGLFQRDYDYDRFWLVLPLVDGQKRPVFPDSVGEVELLVRIYNKEGRVSWAVPECIRQRTAALVR